MQVPPIILSTQLPRGRRDFGPLEQLLAQLLLHGRRLRERVEAPGRRIGGCFVAGDEEAGGGQTMHKIHAGYTYVGTSASGMSSSIVATE